MRNIISTTLPGTTNQYIQIDYSIQDDFWYITAQGKILGKACSFKSAKAKLYEYTENFCDNKIWQMRKDIETIMNARNEFLEKVKNWNDPQAP